MTRPTRRGIVKALRAPGPEPPPELGQRIKERIPEDLFSIGRAAEPSPAPRFGGRASWALAASVVVAIGAGYLAARRFEEQRDSAPELAAAVDALDAPISAPAAPAPPAQAPAAQAQSAPPPVLRKDEAIGASRPEPTEPDSRRSGDLTGSPELSRRVERSAQRLAAADAPEGELGGAAGAPAPAAAAAAKDAGIDSADEVDTAAHEAGSAEVFAVARRRESLDLERAPASAAAMKQNSALADGGRDAQAAGGLAGLARDLLDAAAARPGVARGAIYVEGTPARTPGRFWALVTVVAARSSAGDGLPSADRIAVELESTAARGYRLVASSASPLAVPRPVAGRAASVPLYRLSALYEIDLSPSPAGARGSGPATSLGAVRWRESEASTPSSPTSERVTIDSGGAGGWDEARAELRLAVLAFELTQLPGDAPAALISPIEHDLDRLLADTAADPALSRRAAELRAIASDTAKAPADPLDEPASAPARDHG